MRLWGLSGVSLSRSVCIVRSTLCQVQWSDPCFLFVSFVVSITNFPQILLIPQISASSFKNYKNNNKQTNKEHHNTIIDIPNPTSSTDESLYICTVTMLPAVSLSTDESLPTRDIEHFLVNELLLNTFLMNSVGFDLCSLIEDETFSARLNPNWIHSMRN